MLGLVVGLVVSCAVNGCAVVGDLFGLAVRVTLRLSVGVDVVGDLLGLSVGVDVIGDVLGIAVGNLLGLSVGVDVVGDLLGLAVGVDVIGFVVALGVSVGVVVVGE